MEACRIVIIMLLAFALKTDAEVRTIITPSQVVLTSSVPLFTRIMCSISQNTSLHQVITIQLLGARDNEHTFHPIAEVNSANPDIPKFVTNAPSDLVSRGRVAGGIERLNPASSTLVLTLHTEEVVCTDKGEFECSLTYQDDKKNVQTSKHTETLSVYTLPGNVHLNALKDGQDIHGTIYKKADMNIGEVVEFTCSANIGSDPTTKINWRRTEATDKYNFFEDYDPPFGTLDDGTPIATTDCRYYRNATLSYEVSPMDANKENNLAFQCYVSVLPPNGQGIYETRNPTAFYINPISQAQLNLSPDEVVLSSSTPEKTTFTCSVSRSASVSEVIAMQLLRKVGNDTNFRRLAEVKSVAPELLYWSSRNPHDILSRGTVSGAINMSVPEDSELMLSMNTKDVMCADKGQYQCSLTYRDETNTVSTSRNNRSLSIYTLPSHLSLNAKKNGQKIQGTIETKADVGIAETVEFTCSAEIGSDRKTKIKWRRTAENGTTDEFVDYDPPRGSFYDGFVYSKLVDCRYHRTATMRYNVTKADVLRGNNLAFQCYISVIPPNGQGVYVTQTPPTFYINPTLSRDPPICTTLCKPNERSIAVRGTMLLGAAAIGSPVLVLASSLVTVLIVSAV